MSAKVIPILPCTNINEQCAFYESIGFTTVAKYTAPNPYAVVQYDDITLHFWGSKKHIPEHNASCVFIEVDDVDTINELFCDNIKKATGKVPRTGFGRITQTRSLKEDRRFTLCDPAGNTFYIGTPQTDCPDRTLDNSQHSKMFAVAYDLLHSHENPEKAAKTLP
jgi:predicted enzyme related to lactoylglutathione lyase